jgi:hypothetical protein
MPGGGVLRAGCVGGWPKATKVDWPALTVTVTPCALTIAVPSWTETFDARDADHHGQHRAAHPNCAGRRGDLVIGLGQDASRAAGDPLDDRNRDGRIARVGIEDKAVEHHLRRRPDRQLGAVVEDDARRAVVGSVDGFVLEHVDAGAQHRPLASSPRSRSRC